MHNVPFASQFRVGPSSTRQPSGIVPRCGFFPPTGNPRFSNNPNVGFPYGWNWTSGVAIGTQEVGSSYLCFGHNLGGFNPFGGPSMEGNGGPFQPPPLGEAMFLFNSPLLDLDTHQILPTKVSQWYPLGIHTIWEDINLCPNLIKVIIPILQTIILGAYMAHLVSIPCYL